MKSLIIIAVLFSGSLLAHDSITVPNHRHIAHDNGAPHYGIHDYHDDDIGAVVSSFSEEKDEPKVILAPADDYIG